jgi:hypothetical protein
MGSPGASYHRSNIAMELGAGKVHTGINQAVSSVRHQMLASFLGML